MSTLEDLWKTDQASYDEAEFYTRSKDKQGHGVIYHVRIPDDLAGVLNYIVQSGKIPEYRTVQDIFRDAIVHRIHWISENEKRLREIDALKTIQVRIALENNTTRYLQELQAYTELVDKVRDCCEAALRVNDYKYLEKYLNEQKDLVEVENIRDPFRAKIMNIIQEYQNILQNILQAQRQRN